MQHHIVLLQQGNNSKFCGMFFKEKEYPALDKE